MPTKIIKQACYCGKNIIAHRVTSVNIAMDEGLRYYHIEGKCTKCSCKSWSLDHLSLGKASKAIKQMAVGVKRTESGHF